MEHALATSELLAGAISSFFWWAGFLLFLIIIRNFVIAGFTRGTIALLSQVDENTQRVLVKGLTNENKTRDELFAEVAQQIEPKIREKIAEEYKAKASH